MQPTEADTRELLLKYLQSARQAMLWKVEGLDPYDARRPLVPTGTNLLGLVRHLTSVEGGYFGEVFGRPFPLAVDHDFDNDPNADLWVPADVSDEDVLAAYRAVWVHSDETIAAHGLADTVTVPWWGDRGRDVTLQTLLVHVLAETNRHAGHADIVRELIDGAAGLIKGNENLGADDAASWEAHRGRVQEAADRHR